MRKWAAWIALILLAAGFALWRTGKPARSLEHEPLISFAPADVARITIAVPKEPKVVLVRKGTGWQVQIGKDKQGLADRELVEQLLHTLARAKIVRIVAHSHRHDAEFRLDAASRVLVVLADAAGHTLARLKVGKQSAGDLVSTYVRKDGADEVLAVDEALVWLVRKPADAWLAPKETQKEDKPSARD